MTLIRTALTACAIALMPLSALAQNSSCKVGFSQYEQLQSGMSYQQAVRVLGCDGRELSRSDMAGYRTVMYMWSGNSPGGNMNAMFQNDELVSKAQFGLR